MSISNNNSETDFLLKESAQIITFYTNDNNDNNNSINIINPNNIMNTSIPRPTLVAPENLQHNIYSDSSSDDNDNAKENDNQKDNTTISPLYSPNESINHTNNIVITVQNVKNDKTDKTDKTDKNTDKETTLLINSNNIYCDNYCCFIILTSGGLIGLTLALIYSYL